MTNFEKWKDEIADICDIADNVAIVNGIPVGCNTLYDCTECGFDGINECDYQLLEWAASEYEEPAPKLTKREREFLECFNIMENKEIRRNYCGLSANYVFEKNNKITFAIDGKLFPFIKEGESWTFEELMRLEVEE